MSCAALWATLRSSGRAVVAPEWRLSSRRQGTFTARRSPDHPPIRSSDKSAKRLRHCAAEVPRFRGCGGAMAPSIPNSERWRYRMHLQFLGYARPLPNGAIPAAASRILELTDAANDGRPAFTIAPEKLVMSQVMRHLLPGSVTIGRTGQARSGSRECEFAGV